MNISRRIRDKYEAEMAELERSERMALEKFNEMKVSWIFVVLLLSNVHTLIFAITD